MFRSSLPAYIAPVPLPEAIFNEPDKKHEARHHAPGEQDQAIGQAIRQAILLETAWPAGYPAPSDAPHPDVPFPTHKKSLLEHYRSRFLFFPQKTVPEYIHAKKLEMYAMAQLDSAGVEQFRRNSAEAFCRKFRIPIADMILNTNTAKIAWSKNFLTTASKDFFANWINLPSIKAILKHQQYLQKTMPVTMDDILPGSVLFTLDCVDGLLPESDAHMHTIAAQSRPRFNGIDDSDFKAPPNITHVCFFLGKPTDKHSRFHTIRETRGDEFGTKTMKNLENGIRAGVYMVYTPKDPDLRKLIIEAGQKLDGMPYSKPELGQSMKMGNEGRQMSLLNEQAKAEFAEAVSATQAGFVASNCSTSAAKIMGRALWKKFAKQLPEPGMDQANSEVQYERAQKKDFFDQLPPFIKTNLKRVSPRHLAHLMAKDEDNMTFGGILTITPEQAGPQRCFEKVMGAEITDYDAEFPVPEKLDAIPEIDD